MDGYFGVLSQPIGGYPFDKDGEYSLLEGLYGFGISAGSEGGSNDAGDQFVVIKEAQLHLNNIHRPLPVVLDDRGKNYEAVAGKILAQFDPRVFQPHVLSVPVIIRIPCVKDSGQGSFLLNPLLQEKQERSRDDHKQDGSDDDNLPKVGGSRFVL